MKQKKESSFMKAVLHSVLGDFPKEHKTLTIFMKRFIKYFSILAVLMIMILPMFINSYTLAKQLTIDKSDLKLKEGMSSFEAEVRSAQEIANLIRQEDVFRRLFFLEGFPSSEYYMDFNTIHAKLYSLALTQDMLANVYIMFRENPVFISNYISSDNFRDVYDKHFHYKDISVDEWKSLMFNNNSVHNVQVIPAKQIFSSYYANRYFEGITILINNSYYNFIDQKSVMAFIYNKRDVISKILHEEQYEDHFVYVADANHNLIVSHNYDETESLGAANHLDEVSLSGHKYILLTYNSDSLGLYTVVGIPSESFQRNVNSLLELVLIYLIIGTLITLILSLLFSMKETFWLKKVIESASKSTNTIFNTRNEYSYINHAITRMTTINEEQLTKINTLNNSIKYSVLKNLLVLGVYTERQKVEVESYFKNNFDHYCVAKLNYKIDEMSQVDKAVQQNIVLEIENTFRRLIENDFVALNFLSNESIFVIFLDESEAYELKPIKKKLFELIRAMNVGMQISITINIGLSQIVSNMENAKQAYQQAIYALSVHQDNVSSGVYEYETKPETSNKQHFDMAVLLKLYDAIIVGEQSIVSEIFESWLKNLKNYSLTQQEQLQIFFSFRQMVENTHKVIVDRNLEDNEQHLVTLPDYDQVKDVIKLFTELSHVAAKLCDIVNMNKKSNNEQLKFDILEYIKGNFTDATLSAGSIAAELMISEKYVFSFVKEQTGRSLGKFIEEVRLANAERLLLETKYSNSKILKMCGFGSENTFYRAFSKKHGVSPTVWRDNMKP